MAQPLPEETIAVSDTAWVRLAALRREPKFIPHEYPPLGYTGADTPEDLAPLTAIVNEAIDQVLALKSDRLSASLARPPLRRAAARTELFATEDRDRVWGYLVEVWYILGFHTPLFVSMYGDAFVIPEGYSEPLPPGWSAPDKPRPIG